MKTLLFLLLPALVFTKQCLINQYSEFNGCLTKLEVCNQALNECKAKDVDRVVTKLEVCNQALNGCRAKDVDSVMPIIVKFYEKEEFLLINSAEPNVQALRRSIAERIDAENEMKVSFSTKTGSQLLVATDVDLEIAIRISKLEANTPVFVISVPTQKPTSEPTIHPTNDPTSEPTIHPTVNPTSEPTIHPTVNPTSEPTIHPTANPTSKLQSEILTTEDKEWIIAQLGNNKEYIPLFNTAQHGDETNTFHARCDNQGPTLTIIEATDGSIFGGYASVSWKSYGGYTRAIGSWLFTIKHAKKARNRLRFHQKPGLEQYGIYTSTGYGPTFGGGCDIAIRDGCLSNTNSYSNPHSYESPPESYFTTNVVFQCRQYEVFRIV